MVGPEVRKHRATVPYVVFQSKPSAALANCRDLAWSSQLCLLPWCRLRAGLLVWSAKAGKISAARFQDCVFCGQTVRNSPVHCVGRCAHWKDLRDEFLVGVGLGLSAEASADCLTTTLLHCQPGQSGFLVALKWADAVDVAAAVLAPKRHVY
ncbi:unnamed protein product [Polarella glacialis]|uniref:Uncharacterized protein n=1 Tax=Polarella glacialis TaxID=89957 RepID=A0A813E0F9_POLGL|nr:unnamed protein product [Polarella glacialis]